MRISELCTRASEGSSFSSIDWWCITQKWGFARTGQALYETKSALALHEVWGMSGVCSAERGSCWFVRWCGWRCFVQVQRPPPHSWEHVCKGMVPMEMLLLPKGCYFKAGVCSVPDACTSTPLSPGECEEECQCIAPLGPRWWTSVPNRTKLGPFFCFLNSSSMAKDFLGAATKCLVWRPAAVDTAYQSLEPSSGAFLDYWMKHRWKILPASG